MSAADAAVVIVLGLAVLALLFERTAASAWWAYRRTLTRKRVLVSAHGHTFVGLLWAQRGPLLVLRNVTTHDSPLTDAAVDGELVIERRHVDFVQVMP